MPCRSRCASYRRLIWPSLRTITTIIWTTQRSVRWPSATCPLSPLSALARTSNSWGVPAHRITELDWWQSHTLPNAELTVTAAPSQHFSGRGRKDREATLWSSMVVRSERHSVFFSGDTGLYATIRERLGPFDLVMLEVGAFHPSWGDIHLGPENALKAHALLGGGAFLPVHWGTFSLAMHAWDEPMETLLKLAPKYDAQLLMPRLGQAAEPAQVEAVTHWWRGVDDRKKSAKTVEEPVAQTLPKSMPWPVD